MPESFTNKRLDAEIQNHHNATIQPSQVLLLIQRSKVTMTMRIASF